MRDGHHDMSGPVANYPRDPSGLPPASPSGSWLVGDGDVIDLDGDVIDLAARPVRMRIGNANRDI